MDTGQTIGLGASWYLDSAIFNYNRPEHRRYLVTPEKAVINTNSYGEKLRKYVSAPVSQKLLSFQKMEENKVARESFFK